MKELLSEAFGWQNCEIKPINGYDNANYLVTHDGSNYILKTYAFDSELYEILQAENQLLLHLNKTDQHSYPSPVAFLDQSLIKVLDINEKTSIVRMLSFLDGEFQGDINTSPACYSSIGTFLAKMDLQLRTFESIAFKARQWEWDLQYFGLNKKYLDDIDDPTDRKLVEYFFQQYEQQVTPLASQLRKQIIHNDANEWNVLTRDGKVSAIIDFGDLTYSHLINEVAIAMTYSCYGQDDPLEGMPLLLKSYHEQYPLEEQELKVLYYLIAARLCTSVCNAAHSRKVNPDNTYATVSENSAWKMLRHWIKINPIGAENLFREAVGLSALASSSAETTAKRRHQHVHPILSLSYHEPIKMSRSAFQYMYDAYGHTYLDAYNNIPHVGHSHPRVVAAGQRQMAKLNTNTRYLYDQLADYAEKLLSYFPASLSKVFFVNSGSAASDLALRLAYAHTGHQSIMVMEHGYHGNTQMAMDISDYKFNNPRGQGKKDHVIKTTIPNTYNGKYMDDLAGQKYAADAIRQIASAASPIAAFIAEPIVGCGGQVPLAQGYLKELYPAIRTQGGVCISDEVQTGFGRLGDHFWGYEQQEVVPDIVIVGKPMANGHPMGAVITTDAIADSFGEGVEFFSSFGGNPVSCVIGKTVLEVIEEEQLQENAKVVGANYQSLFTELQKKYDCIGDVRGAGLFIGVEIVNPDNQQPDTTLAQKIKNGLKERFILISTDGPYDNVLKTKPPLCFTKENAKEVVENVDELLSTYFTH